MTFDPTEKSGGQRSYAYVMRAEEGEPGNESRAGVSLGPRPFLYVDLCACAGKGEGQERKHTAKDRDQRRMDTIFTRAL